MNSFFILLLFLSIILTTFNRGFFSLPALVMLISIFFTLFSLFLKNQKFTFKKSDLFSFQLLFVVIYSLFLFFSGGIYQTKNIASLLLYFLPIAFYPLALTYIFKFEIFPPQTLALRFYSFFFLGFLLRILIIIASPTPVIDVFTLLKEAPNKFLAGQNPYTSIFSSVYPGIITDYYPYWPASFLLELPFVSIFSDPRILLLISDLFNALFLFILGGKTRFSEIFSLIYLFRPNSIFILEQSWLTPLPYFFLLLAAFLWRQKREFSVGLTLGLAASIQPVYSFFLPFFLFLAFKPLKVIFGFFLVLFLIVSPFFLLEPSSFWEKTILVYFKPAEATPTIPVYYSLNLNALFFGLLGKNFPGYLSFFAWTILLVFIFYNFYKLKKTEKAKRKNIFPSFVFLGLTFFFYGFYLFFRQAFINYYYFAGGLLLLWLTFLISDS